MEIPELVGLGQVSDEELGRHGAAMLDAFASTLEVRLPCYYNYTAAFQSFQHSLLLFVTDLRSARRDSGLELDPHPTQHHSRRRIPAR